MGLLSAIHSSEVSLVLNPTTTGSSITSQYHVVFDDMLSTIDAIFRGGVIRHYFGTICAGKYDVCAHNAPLLLANALPGIWNTRNSVRFCIATRCNRPRPS
jgi:hypothetical protein